MRLRCDAADDSQPVFFQCTGYEYEAELDEPMAEAVGRTAAVTVAVDDSALAVTAVAEGDASEFSVRLTNRSEGSIPLAPRLSVTRDSGSTHNISF